jgi:hypothetical protein
VAERKEVKQGKKIKKERKAERNNDAIIPINNTEKRNRGDKVTT